MVTTVARNVVVVLETGGVQSCTEKSSVGRGTGGGTLRNGLQVVGSETREPGSGGLLTAPVGGVHLHRGTDVLEVRLTSG